MTDDKKTITKPVTVEKPKDFVITNGGLVQRIYKKYKVLPIRSQKIIDKSGVGIWNYTYDKEYKCE